MQFISSQVKQLHILSAFFFIFYYQAFFSKQRTYSSYRTSEESYSWVIPIQKFFARENFTINTLFNFSFGSTFINWTYFEFCELQKPWMTFCFYTSFASTFLKIFLELEAICNREYSLFLC
jgi:hypothetical protein